MLEYYFKRMNLHVIELFIIKIISIFYNAPHK